MKNHRELSPETVKAILKEAGVGERRAARIRKTLAQTLEQEPLGLKDFEFDVDPDELRQVNGRVAPQWDNSLLAVRLPMEGYDHGEQNVSGTTEEDLIVPGAMADNIMADSANFDHRVAGEVDPDTLSVGDVDSAYFLSSRVGNESDLVTRARGVIASLEGTDAERGNGIHRKNRPVERSGTSRKGRHSRDARRFELSN